MFLKSLVIISLLQLSLFAGFETKWANEFEFDANLSSMVVNSDNSIIAIGGIESKELFPDPDAPPSTPDKNALVVKFEENGSIAWHTIFGSKLTPDVPVVVLEDKNLSNDYETVVVGWTAGELEFNTSSGLIDIFIAKIDFDGNVTDTIQIGTGGRDFPTSAFLDENGILYIAGGTDDLNFRWHGSEPIDFSMNPELEYTEHSNYKPFAIKVDIDKILEPHEFESGRVLFEHQGANPVPFWDLTYETGYVKIELDNDLQFGKSIFFYDGLEVTLLDDVLAPYPVNLVGDFRNFEFSKERNSSGETIYTFFSIDYNGLHKYQYFRSDQMTFSELPNSPENWTGHSLEHYGAKGVFSKELNSYYLAGNGMGNWKPSLEKIKIKDTFIFDNNDSFGEVYFDEYGYPIGHTTVFDIKLDNNGDVVLLGNLHNISVTGGDNNGTTYTFLMKVSDPFVENSISAGWSLLSGNLELDEIPESIEVVFKYGAYYEWNCLNYGDEWSCQGTWKVFSPNPELHKTLTDYSVGGLQEITEIRNRDGIWILSKDENLSLNFGYNDTNISITDYPNSWSLNGIGVETNASEIACRNDMNHSATTWTFQNDMWKINTTDSAKFPTVDRFEILPPNSGFWVNCESNTSY
jgi:hypothetical protein